MKALTAAVWEGEKGLMCVMVYVAWSLTLAILVVPSSCELLWTPILPASQEQVDLWTVSGSGCACSTPEGERGGSLDCACCVNRVACPCGAANPHRCAQCGLQQHCNNMCNVTIDGALLSVTSGRMSGSLVPPGDVAPPLSCWYILRAPPGHRVEVQLHRLVHVGHSINGTT
ncbi:uncharacterized protein LOC122254082 [Penaeus japonicus]|uniref:uncharacterized protein LOC122254082 n=1 Tax=Penaeus japonicus TaxID=27405 RepID=UPI001C716F92|nr:uncharacterized protein LOC122254082 [Penaeus japonicus]